ncbi:MAG: SpoIID/LytB domain-containing protein [Candidatus Eremiobacteraeota bacterium]|nr:SpoIID/LytB domain-containing protein [Candidatus Eremiobacteraeota bacterium]MBV8223006.1 SpoIID/LytB domain-containing protein [Candidatus Eremiobacteraeota bacterium]MBV8281899.1 SpoIID/LytB domain-containing protein [Candidatus Eremiobacteraeota bacterium]
MLVFVFALAGSRASSAQTIRVLLFSHQLQTVIASEGGLVVRAPDNAQPLLQPEVNTVMDVHAGPDGLVLAGAVQAGNRVLAEPLMDAPLVIDGRTYRGRAWITREDDGTMDVIDELDLEQYLYGVVGAEMDPTWPEVALQAQAIASRSYAAARVALHQHPGYDVASGEQDQAYGGVNVETQRSVDAVESTRGVVMVYQYHVITAYYSSCDGGYTADGSNLDDPEPYLHAVPDPYAAESPHLSWSASVPLAPFAQSFREQVGDVGDITAVTAGPADASGRLTSVTVAGTTGSRTISGKLFRQLAGRHVVKSTRISALALQDDAIAVSGSGFGHGVGMSQWGAKDMADQGLGINAILSFYYRGAMLSKI